VNLSERVRWIYLFAGSKGIALCLFTVLCLVLIPETFLKGGNIYLAGLRIATLGLIGLNLLFCTFQRAGTLSKSVFIIHLGAVMVLLGGVVSSSGFVATVNVYEKSTVDEAFRWDIKQDVPLGVQLTVEKVNMEYYPIPVKVGVLRGEDKIGLFVLETGKSFNIEDYTVRPDSIEFPSENLQLSVFRDGSPVGFADTSGMRDLPPEFPFEFVLVAYRNPSLKRTWLDLKLTKGSEVVAEGITEVNSPLSAEGLDFHHTKVDRDAYGMTYAGLQITRDPGRPYVYAGFTVIGFGSVLYLFNYKRKNYGSH
jgi:hypothetical protein